MAGAGADMANPNIATRVGPDDVLAGPATAWYPSGTAYGPRTLTDFELVWLLSGSARWQAGGGPAHRLAPGQVLLVPPGVTDRFRWDESTSTRHGYVHFRLPGADGSGWPAVRTLSRDDPLDGLLRYLLWLAGTAGADVRERIAGVLGLAVDVFVRGPWPATAAAGWPPPLAALAEAVARAWADGMRPVALSDLAAAAGYSPGHLNRSFRGRFGISVAAGLERVRLQRAEVLLRRSDLSVTQVARLCGFPDPLHFSRRFRAVHGCPPRDFRAPGVVGASVSGALQAFADKVAALNFQ